MMQVFCFFFLIFLIFWQADIFTAPLVLVVFLLLSIFSKKTFVFSLAFFGGLLFDVLSTRPLGVTALFFLTFLLMTMLYERKFEVMTLTFVGFALFFGSFFYLLLFHFSHVLLQSIFTAFVGAISFAVLRVFFKNVRSEST